MAAMPRYKNEVITIIISQNCTAAASSIIVTVGNFQSIGGGSIVPDVEWMLWIADRGNTNTGQLLNWSISFDGSEAGIKVFVDNCFKEID